MILCQTFYTKPLDTRARILYYFGRIGGGEGRLDESPGGGIGGWGALKTEQHSALGTGLAGVGRSLRGDSTGRATRDEEGQLGTWIGPPPRRGKRKGAGALYGNAHPGIRSRAGAPSPPVRGDGAPNQGATTRPQAGRGSEEPWRHQRDPVRRFCSVGSLRCPGVPGTR